MTCTSRWPVCPEGSRVAVKTDNPGWCEIMGGQLELPSDWRVSSGERFTFEKLRVSSSCLTSRFFSHLLIYTWRSPVAKSTGVWHKELLNGFLALKTRRKQSDPVVGCRRLSRWDQKLRLGTNRPTACHLRNVSKKITLNSLVESSEVKLFPDLTFAWGVHDSHSCMNRKFSLATSI